MTGLEPESPGVRRDHSANWTTTTARWMICNAEHVFRNFTTSLTQPSIRTNPAVTLGAYLGT